MLLLWLVMFYFIVNYGGGIIISKRSKITIRENVKNTYIFGRQNRYEQSGVGLGSELWYRSHTGTELWGGMVNSFLYDNNSIHIARELIGKWYRNIREVLQTYSRFVKMRNLGEEATSDMNLYCTWRF